MRCDAVVTKLCGKKRRCPFFSRRPLFVHGRRDNKRSALLNLKSADGCERVRQDQKEEEERGEREGTGDINRGKARGEKRKGRGRRIREDGKDNTNED